MKLLRRISDWFKYERLHHYPALSAFDRDEALKRLHRYEREEREACQPWLNIVWTLLIAGWLVLVASVWMDPILRIFVAFAQVPGYSVQYYLHRRIRRRVEAKVAAELHDGRLWTCLECGYDLRASEVRCPECGEPVRVGDPK